MSTDIAAVNPPVRCSLCGSSAVTGGSTFELTEGPPPADGSNTMVFCSRCMGRFNLTREKQAEYVRQQQLQAEAAKEPANLRKATHGRGTV